MTDIHDITRRYGLIIFIALLVVLSITDWVDSSSANYVDQAIGEGVVIYGTARGINAIVSVIQETNLDIYVVELGVGQVLDPVNDLIERFSSVMTWSIAALAIQKFMLVTVSHGIFQIALAGVGIVAVILIFLRLQLAALFAVRVFFVMVFLRLSLGLVVIANMWVDQAFLIGEESAEYKRMQVAQGQFEEVDRLFRSKVNETDIREISVHSKSLRDLSEQKGILEQKQVLIEAEIEEMKKEVKWMECALRSKKPICGEIREKDDELSSVELDIKAVSKQMKEIEKMISALSKPAKSACGWISWLSEDCIEQATQQIDQLGATVQLFAEDTIRLLASMVLKSILLPIAFLYFLLITAKALWSVSPRLTTVSDQKPSAA